MVTGIIKEIVLLIPSLKPLQVALSVDLSNTGVKMAKTPFPRLQPELIQVSPDGPEAQDKSGLWCDRERKPGITMVTVRSFVQAAGGCLIIGTHKNH